MKPKMADEGQNSLVVSSACAEINAVPGELIN